MSHIFVSYSHQDTIYAQKLVGKLQSDGFEVWIDERLDYGSQWPLELQQKLDTCSAFILLMSPRSYTSEWVQSELSRAKRKSKPIFPLLLDGDEPWLSVESIQYFDVRNENLPDSKFYTALERSVVRGKQPTQSYSMSQGSPYQKPAQAIKYRPEIIVAVIGGIATLLAVLVPIVWSNVFPPPTPVPTSIKHAAISPPTSTTVSAVNPPTATLEVAEVVPTFTPADIPVIYGFQACPAACNGQNSTNNFAGGITKIYFQFNYENFKPGISYARTWTMGGREWIRYTCAWDGPSSGTEVLKLTEPKGLASGTWKLKVIVDNVVLLQEEIVIVGNWTYWDPAGVINACHGTN
jgi:TIR domain-containing protein